MEKKEFNKHPFVKHEPIVLDEEIMLEHSKEFYDHLNKRRTVRDFSPKPIPFEVIENIVSANDIEIAIVQPELEVLGWSKRLKEKGSLPCKALLPNYDLIKLLADKGEMTKRYWSKHLSCASVLSVKSVVLSL